MPVWDRWHKTGPHHPTRYGSITYRRETAEPKWDSNLESSLEQSVALEFLDMQCREAEGGVNDGSGELVDAVQNALMLGGTFAAAVTMSASVAAVPRGT